MNEKDFHVGRLAGLIDAIGGHIDMFARDEKTEVDTLEVMQRSYGLPSSIFTRETDGEWYNVYCWELRPYPNRVNVSLFGSAHWDKQKIEDLAKFWRPGVESV